MSSRDNSAKRIEAPASGFMPLLLRVEASTDMLNPGEDLWVSGEPGAAAAGRLLRAGQLRGHDPAAIAELARRFDYPEPRLELGYALRGIASAMIDISDGLASELFHICKRSNVGAFIEESGVPIHPDAQMMALKFNLDPITCALSGGEDYELLFTIDPKDVDKVKYLPDIYIMGEIVEAADGLKLHTKGGNIHELQAQGWRHFDPNRT